MCTDINKIFEDEDYMNIIKSLINNELVQKMKEFRQHFHTNCFEHCLLVSYNTYEICKKYKLDYVSAARAGLLHDLFLYDWRKRQDGRKGYHAFTHPKTALENAKKITKLNDKEIDIIKNHMWPVTIKFPKYRETYILTYVDKYFAIHERKRI